MEYFPPERTGDLRARAHGSGCGRRHVQGRGETGLRSDPRSFRPGEMVSGPRGYHPSVRERRAHTLRPPAGRQLDKNSGTAAAAVAFTSELAVPPASRRHSGHALERTIERRLGFVADVGSDRGETIVAVANSLRGKLHSPACHIFDRRLP